MQGIPHGLCTYSLSLVLKAVTPGLTHTLGIWCGGGWLALPLVSNGRGLGKSSASFSSRRILIPASHCLWHLEIHYNVSDRQTLRPGDLGQLIYNCLVLGPAEKRLVPLWKVKVFIAQLCPTLCKKSLPGSSGHGILQARILEWILEWDFPNPGFKPRSPTLQADSLPSDPPGKSINTLNIYSYICQLFLNNFLKDKNKNSGIHISK